MNKIIEDYILLQKIGQGQYGNVYKSQNRKTKTFYAVKVMNVEKFKHTPKLSEFTNNQISILSKINHVNIIKFIEMLRTTNNYYLVYEFCNGGTLAQYIKSKGKLSEQEAIKIFLQLRSAFQCLNAQNILHRDLKPTNILFHNGVIKIADFGFCKQLMKETDMTQTMVGSPIYMAPQVLKGLIYDSRADIWSLGVILYQMLYGICPYEESSIPKLVSLIDNTMLRFPSNVAVSDNIKNLIKRMLTIKYRDRISPSQFIKYPIQTADQTKKKQSQSLSFKDILKFLRRNLAYLGQSAQLLAMEVDDLNYLRLCFMVYKIIVSFIKDTAPGAAYWQNLKLQNNDQKLEQMYQNQGVALRPFGQQLRQALFRTDSSLQTKLQLQTSYLGPKYYMETVELIQNSQMKERLYNCLLINKHFINVLQKKNPDFTDYPGITNKKSMDDKRDLCRKYAKMN